VVLRPTLSDGLPFSLLMKFNYLLAEVCHIPSRRQDGEIKMGAGAICVDSSKREIKFKWFIKLCHCEERFSATKQS
jgi:hypothetical protein